MRRTLSLLAGACTLAIAAGCAAPTSNAPVTAGSTYPSSSAPYQTSSSYGQVTNIALVDQKAGTSGAGAVLGAVLGGVLGNQVGGGDGRTAATVAGAVAGGYVGNKVEQNRAGTNEVYRVDVRFEDGRTETFNFHDLNGLRVGDRVRTEGGQLYRM
jgi:outer membrane lipoprotein SlyB